MRLLKFGPFLVVVAAVLVGCSSSASPAGTVATSSTTSAEVLAVAHKVWSQGAGNNPCSQANIDQCPVTARLATRIQQLETPSAAGPGPGDLWCRCQNVGNVVMTADVTPTVGIAHVDFGTGGNLVDFIMIEQGGRLLVDDTQCTGRGSSTTIYLDPVPLCG
jgi:hypothetical protein